MRMGASCSGYASTARCAPLGYERPGASKNAPGTPRSSQGRSLRLTDGFNFRSDTPIARRQVAGSGTTTISRCAWSHSIAIKLPEGQLLVSERACGVEKFVPAIDPQLPFAVLRTCLTAKPRLNALRVREAAVRGLQDPARSSPSRGAVLRKASENTKWLRAR